MVLAVPATRAQDDLPPDVQFDVLRLELANAAHDGHSRQVLIIAQKMRKLGHKMPPETSFYEARAFYALGAPAMARRALTTYFKKNGRKGANYQDAIHLYVKIKTEQDKKVQAARTAAGLRASWEAAREAWLADKAEVAAWKKRAVVFGGPGEDSATALARAPDGGIIVAGAFYVHKREGDDKTVDATLPWITAFNAKGIRVWHRPLGGTTDAGSLRSVVPVPGRGYLFGGTQKGFQMVAMTDRLGNEIANADGDPWIIGFSPAPHGEGGIGRLLPNGDILALGAVAIGKDAKTGHALARLPVAVRLAPNGKVRGKAVFGRDAGTSWFDVQDAVVLPDGGAIVAGETRRTPDDATTAEGYVLRIAPNGKESWLRRIASRTGKGMALTALAATADGGVIAVGRDADTLAYLKLNGAGDVVWRKWRAPHEGPVAGAAEFCSTKNPAAALAAAYKNKPANDASRAVARDLGAVKDFACRRGHGFRAATAITKRYGGGFLILGIAGRKGDTTTRITLTAIRPDGSVAWETRQGDNGANMATAALPTGDGGFAVAGVTTNWGRDVALFKIDGRGRLQPFTGLAPKAEPRPARSTKARPAAKASAATAKTAAPASAATKTTPKDKSGAGPKDETGSAQKAPPSAQTANPPSTASAKANGGTSTAKAGSPAQGGSAGQDGTPEISLGDLLDDIFGATPRTSPQPRRP